jgi:Saccharopine dehydrogenase NADP binding domain
MRILTILQDLRQGTGGWKSRLLLVLFGENGQLHARKAKKAVTDLADRHINRSISVAVVGAAGTVGTAVVNELAASQAVVTLRLIDAAPQRLAVVAAEHGGRRATTHVVDAAAPEALDPHLRGVDVVVNAAPYRLNLDVMRACLRVRCNYVDLGGMHWLTRQQLELNGEFVRAGRLAILGLGANPGVVNVLAVKAMRELADMGASVGIESVEVFDAIQDPHVPSDGRLRPPYSLQTLVDELAMNPIVRRRGNEIELEPRADGGIVDFGAPIHEAETVYTLGACVSTLGRSFGAAGVSLRSAFLPSPLVPIRGLLSAEPEQNVIPERLARANPASNETVRVMLVRARATSGHNVTVRAQANPHAGFGGAVSGAAAPIALAVRMFARGELGSLGALAPERCIEPEEFFTHLEARGYAFQTRQGWRSPSAPKPAPREIIVP